MIAERVMALMILAFVVGFVVGDKGARCRRCERRDKRRAQSHARYAGGHWERDVTKPPASAVPPGPVWRDTTKTRDSARKPW